MRFLLLAPLLFIFSSSFVNAELIDGEYWSATRTYYPLGSITHFNKSPEALCQAMVATSNQAAEVAAGDGNSHTTYSYLGVTDAFPGAYRSYCNYRQHYPADYGGGTNDTETRIYYYSGCPAGSSYDTELFSCVERSCEYELGHKKDLLFDHMLPSTGSKLCREDCEFTIGSGDGSHSVDICTGGGVCISTAHVSALDCDNATEEPIDWVCPSGWSQHNNVCLPPVGEDPDPFEPDPDPDPDPDPEPDPGTGGGDTGGGDTGGGNTGGGTGGGNTGGGNTGGGNTGGGDSGGGDSGGDTGGGSSGGGECGGVGSNGGGHTGGGNTGGGDNGCGNTGG